MSNTDVKAFGFFTTCAGECRTHGIGKSSFVFNLRICGIESGIGCIPATPPGIRVRTGRFKRLGSGQSGHSQLVEVRNGEQESKKTPPCCHGEVLISKSQAVFRQPGIRRTCADRKRSASGFWWCQYHRRGLRSQRRQLQSCSGCNQHEDPWFSVSYLHWRQS